MILLPVLTRELLVSARKKSTYWARVIATIVTIGMAVWLMIFSAAALGPADQGRYMLLIFTWFAFIYCLFAGADSTSDCISVEKREGTLGLLFLTDLRTMDLLIGKIAATSLHHLYTLLSVVPMLALCLLMGGVAGKEVLYIALVLLNSLFFSISAGAFISTFSVDQRKAMFGAGVVILGAVALPFALEIFYRGEIDAIKPGDPIFIQASPLFPFLAVVNATAFNKGMNALVSVGIVHLAAWLMLFIAAWALPKRIHDSATVKTSRWEMFKRRVMFGAPEQRKAYRRKLLDQNAYFWLTAQERMKASYSWLLFGLYALLFFTVWKFANDLATDLGFPMFMMIVIHGLYKCWIASEVSFRLVEDRRVGAFELLLSTSITPKDIVAGLNCALFRQFSKPFAAMLALDLFIVYSVYSRASDLQSQRYIMMSFIAGQLIFFLDIFGIKWLAAWNSLFSNKQGAVLSRIIMQVLILPWILTVITSLLILFFQKIYSPRTDLTSFPVLVVIWTAYSIALVLAPALHARIKFLKELRTVASNRFDSSERGGVLVSLYAKFSKTKEPETQPFWIRHWILTGCFALLLAVYAGFAIRQYQWKKTVTAQIADLKAKKYPASSLDLAAYIQYVPQDQNAGIFLEQAALLSPNPVFSPGLTYRNGILSEPMPLDEPLSDLILTNIVQLEKRNKAALQALPVITNYPSASFEAQWTHPWSPFDRRTLGIRNIIGGVEAHALMEIERGNLLSAAQSLHHLLLIYKFTGEFPSFQMQHLRRETVMKAANLLERLVSKGAEVNSEQMAVIEKLLKELEKSDNVKNSLVFVRAFAIETCTNSPSAIRSTLFPLQRGPELAIFSIAMGLERITGMQDKKLSAYLDWIEEAIKMTEAKSYAEQLQSAQKLDLESQQERQGGLYPSVVSFFTPYFTWLINEDRFQVTKFSLMRAIIIAEKERLSGGKLPSNLENLEIYPMDPYTNKALRILPTEGGYIIYSLGADSTDQAGVENKKVTQKNSQGDIPIHRVYSQKEPDKTRIDRAKSRAVIRQLPRETTGARPKAKGGL